MASQASRNTPLLIFTPNSVIENNHKHGLHMPVYMTLGGWACIEVDMHIERHRHTGLYRHACTGLDRHTVVWLDCVDEV